MNDYELKKIPADFQVQEVSNFSCQPNNKNEFHYYLISKCGYTTFQAVALLENHFALPPNSLCHSGLKDEDAITSQYISAPICFTLMELEDFNRLYSNRNDQFVRAQYVGSGDHSFKVAKLLGNCFRIKVRNLTERFVSCLKAQTEYTIFALNYYGGQRFGLPNQIKNTHLIGKALIDKNYELALSELLKQKSDTQEAALSFTDQPEQFFSQLRKGQVAFYQNAYYSHIWNKEIIDCFERAPSIPSTQRYVDGIEYHFLQDERDIFKLLGNRLLLENIRVVYESCTFQQVIYKRPSVIQLRVTLEKVECDDLNPNRYSADLSFFSPSGGYATIAVAQFLQTLAFNLKVGHLEESSALYC